MKIKIKKMLYYLLIISGVVFIIYIVIKNNITPEWLTAVGTCGAVVVALFKDNISKFWNKVKLEISYPHPLEEDTVKACDETHNIRASRYFTKLQVKNNSKNCCAEKISCWIDKISVKTTVGQYQDLPIIHEEIKLNKDLIYPQRKLDICLFEISMENSFENNETSILPKKNLSKPLHEPVFKVGENIIDKKDHDSEIKFGISIYAKNCSPIKVCFTLHWDGKWEGRCSEFIKHITIKRDE